MSTHEPLSPVCPRSAEAGSAARRDELFIKEFTASQRQLYAYVMTQVSGWEAVDEIFQRVSLALWTKRENFDPDRPFVAWAVGFARMEVQKYLGEQGRRMLTLTDEALQAVGASFERQETLLEERVCALEACVARLPARQQQLLRNCYASSTPLQDVAREIGMTPNSLYLQLKRLRDLLWKCVTGKVTAEANHA
ncbi:sigma-70 family RNA polymerase sigma factor [Planctomicrobium sp. SH664]|uniref:sigma-70 family RNA polymerase sigma factor n=1 Tax=Planctomicrobium sp. SH664 TaxID=3448125 RepID=UPI003F5BD4AF